MSGDRSNSLCPKRVQIISVLRLEPHRVVHMHICIIHSNSFEPKRWSRTCSPGSSTLLYYQASNLALFVKLMQSWCCIVAWLTLLAIRWYKFMAKPVTSADGATLPIAPYTDQTSLLGKAKKRRRQTNDSVPGPGPGPPKPILPKQTSKLPEVSKSFSLVTGFLQHRPRHDTFLLNVGNNCSEP